MFAVNGENREAFCMVFVAAVCVVMGGAFADCAKGRLFREERNGVNAVAVARLT
jgi:hypothetical protein